MEALQIFQRRSFPKVEAAGVLGRGDKGEFDAGTESEDAVAGDFEISVTGLVVKQIMLLATFDDFGRKIQGTQQQTQTVCPLTDVFFLPGESGRPMCAAICR